MRRVWEWIKGFGRFWYGFIIGDDWAAAAGVLVMLGAAYGLRLLHVTAWWAGPVVIAATLLVTLRRAGTRQRRNQADGTSGDDGHGGARQQATRQAARIYRARKQEVMDITELIMADHHEQRRMFALLDEVGDHPEQLEPVWHRLSILLEVHADAEEKLFYPRLLKTGEGAGDAGSAGGEAKDAIRDHNDIRDGLRRARRQPVGSDEWWRAVTDTRIANSDHMAEEEREALADFRRHTAPQARHDLAVEFAVYEAAHAGGVPLADKDPDRYARQHAS